MQDENKLNHDCFAIYQVLILQSVQCFPSIHL